ncbi:MAG: hypothetical protein Q8R44_10205 [Novosphingobium sp.]|nr:hypothetical protein [Novosphingobium sp.]
MKTPTEKVRVHETTQRLVAGGFAGNYFASPALIRHTGTAMSM